MAVLLKRSDILGLIKKRPQSIELTKAESREEDIKFYVIGDEDQDEGLKRFQNWLKGQIASEKYQEFLDVITYPIPTADLTEMILNDLSKVLESYNRNITSIRFHKDSETNGKSFETQYKIGEIMSNKVFPTFRTSPNSLIVIEPSQGAGVAPELYFVNVSRIVHIEQSVDGDVDFAVWTTDDKGKRFAACDAEAFYFINAEEGIDSARVSKIPHQMGVTPARYIYPVFRDVNQRISVDSPLVNQLGKLRWYLFFSLAKRVLDKSAPFPIYSHYASACTWEEHGEVCNGGIIKTVEVNDEGEEKIGYKKCPVCNSKKNKNNLIAGSRIEIRPPKDKNDVDLRNPVQVLSAEEISINFAVKEQERLEQHIYYSVVGKTLVPLESFSASVDQIDVAQESRKNTLMKMKKVFEKTHDFIVTCFARNIYGDGFIESEVDYGDNWFLRTTEQELKTYESLKGIQAPPTMMIEQLKNIARRQYSTSPDERERQLLLLDLEPFVTETPQVVLDWYSKGIVDKELVVSKIYFHKIIMEIEKEIGNLGTFLNSSSSTYKAKRDRIVSIIGQKVEEYSQKLKINLNNEENGNKSKQGGSKGEEPKD